MRVTWHAVDMLFRVYSTVWANDVCDAFVCYWRIDTHFVLFPTATNQVKLLHQEGQLIAKMHLCQRWCIFGENILQIIISTPFTSIKTLNLEPSLNLQTGLKDIQYLYIYKNNAIIYNLFYRLLTGRMRHTYTFSHFLSLPELSEKTQDRPTWRWSRCVLDVMSPVRRVSWETGMAWPVKPQWAGGVILQLKDRLRDSHMAHISKWQPVTGRRSTIRPCHLSPDWTRPTVFSS